MRVLCIRNNSNGCNIDADRCNIFDLLIPQLSEWWRNLIESISGSSGNGSVEAVGWERDGKGRHRPRIADLRSSMDPRCLASSAVELNLKLMRWRVLPELNLENMNSTSCLLIGAGTLGCNVSRLLMAWGIRKITFVDNGKVSYSNPVRQSLYTFKDCQQDRPKAIVAAEALKEVFPDIDAEGICMAIPMPGHPAAESERGEIQNSIEVLEKLIENHTVIYLLTDTRESRWLPTLLCAKFRKLCINAALGFDSYVVLRHGMPVNGERRIEAVSEIVSESSTTRLGCYFCNDVVAPLDSTVRTK